MGFAAAARILIAADIFARFRFFFMMDDNVRVWKAQRISEGDSAFANLPYPLECSTSGKLPSKKDVPLSAVAIRTLAQLLCVIGSHPLSHMVRWQVLKHFQDAAFRSEMCKFGMIGFDRLGRREVSSRLLRVSFPEVFV
jgi:hypothetical protein